MLSKSFSGYGLPLSLVISAPPTCGSWAEHRHVSRPNHAFITATAAMAHYDAGRSPSLCASASPENAPPGANIA